MHSDAAAGLPDDDHGQRGYDGRGKASLWLLDVAGGRDQGVVDRWLEGVFNPISPNASSSPASSSSLLRLLPPRQAMAAGPPELRDDVTAHAHTSISLFSPRSNHGQVSVPFSLSQP